MMLEQQRRMLLRHGFVFLFIAPCLGLAIMFLPNPRGWLAAHVTAFLTAFVLATVGLVWRELRLGEGQRKAVLLSGLTAAYVGLAGNIFGAIVDLPGPASSPGVAPPMPEAAILLALLAIIIPATFTSFALVLFGLRGQPTPVTSVAAS